MALSFSFDGVKRSCVKFKKVSGIGWRCAEFQKGLKHPKCPSGPLKGGGRSQNYLRNARASSPPKCGPGQKSARLTTKHRRHAHKR